MQRWEKLAALIIASSAGAIRSAISSALKSVRFSIEANDGAPATYGKNTIQEKNAKSINNIPN